MRNLVPVKVKIGLKNNSHAKYPDFNLLDAVKASGLDWSYYVDINGLGWHYDKKCGHKEEAADSLFGMQWGVLVIPQDFADQAAVAFPAEVTKLTEAELEDFYDNRAHAHEPDEEMDATVLQGIKMKQDLGLPLTPQQTAALDPNDDTRGIRKNKRRKWADFKQLVGVNIVAES